MNHVAVHPEHLNLLSLCTGGGGLDLGLELAIPGARSVVLVEREAFAVAQLVSAMEAGHMAKAPIWSDAGTFNGRRWRGSLDGLIGGIPCQPHSIAGRRLGEDDERDLWSDARRIIVQSGVWFVVIENVGGMLSAKPGLDPGALRVRRDLYRLGFDIEGGLFTASEVGASHQRERVFILAVANDCSERGASGLSASTGWHGVGSEPAIPDDGSDPRRSGVSEQSLADATGAGRRSERTIGGPDASGRSGKTRRLQSGRLGREVQPDSNVVDAEGIGRGEGRAEPELWSGRSSAPEPSRLFPPGPGDIPGWLEALGERPDLAPVLRGAIDVADSDGQLRGHGHDGEVGDGGLRPHSAERGRVTVSGSGFRRAKSGFRRVDDGVADRVDRLRMLGNGVVPLQAAYAVRTLATRLAERGSPGAARLVRMMEID